MSQWAGFKSPFSKTFISLSMASEMLSELHQAESWGADDPRNREVVASLSTDPDCGTILKSPPFKLLPPREVGIYLRSSHCLEYPPSFLSKFKTQHIFSWPTHGSGTGHGQLQPDTVSEAAVSYRKMEWEVFRKESIYARLEKVSSFTQYLFTEHLLCSRQCVRYG